MIKVLAIGNSFSQDATRYLHDIAAADGLELKVVNLYIGGCSLNTHINNAVKDLPLYTYELNGKDTGKMISIKDALLADKWDVVTLQQVSHESICYETFQPYLSRLTEYVRKYAPDAKQMIHQTWAYEDNSERLNRELSYNRQEDMFTDIERSYDNAAKDLGNLQIIPSGKAFQIAISHGLENLYRDTFHASLGLGRYILGAVWYEILTGNSIKQNTFCDFDEPVDEKEQMIAKKSAAAAGYEYSGIKDVPYSEYEECRLDIQDRVQDRGRFRV